MQTSNIISLDHYLAIVRCVTTLLNFYKELTRETLGYPFFIYNSFSNLINYITINKEDILRDGLYKFYIKLELLHHSISQYCLDNLRLLSIYNETYTKIRYGMKFYDVSTREQIDYPNLIILSCGHMYNDNQRVRIANKCEECGCEINFIIDERNRGDSHRILLLHHRLNTIGNYHFSKVKEIEHEENEIDLLLL